MRATPWPGRRGTCQRVPHGHNDDLEGDLAGRRESLHRRSASNDKDIKEYAASDLLIVAIAAFVLIFLIMLFLTRSLMAALVIPGTVAFVCWGVRAFILVWQHLIGLPLHWLVLPLTFIILVAVGSDYNLLLTVRVKEELHAEYTPVLSAPWAARAAW
ncbi:MMPL family protein [Mycobacterium xenopi 4042]|uniref:MMPL family protein n=1 Tax=Mycobacterium xenopi 4042 TaxID=1299334 RepID=X7ZNT7_MYCXE|nr:MMPL family protein [Mycobacterium xenopi 4042]